MNLSGFLVYVHLDRFEELKLVIGDNDVDIDVVSIGENHTVEVFLSGDENFIIRLGQSLRRISDILSSTPLREEV